MFFGPLSRCKSHFLHRGDGESPLSDLFLSFPESPHQLIIRLRGKRSELVFIPGKRDYGFGSGTDEKRWFRIFEKKKKKSSGCQVQDVKGKIVVLFTLGVPLKSK